MPRSSCLALIFVAGPIAATVISGLAADLLRLAGEPAVQQATVTSIVLRRPFRPCFRLPLPCRLPPRQALARRRATRTSFLESLAGTGAGFVLVVPPDRHRGRLVRAAQALRLSLRRRTDHGGDRERRHGHAFRHPRHPSRAYDAAAERNDRLCAQLGIAGWNRARLIDWPVLRRPIATGFAFAMALSLGDLGVIALFGSDSVQTLPYLLLGAAGLLPHRRRGRAGAAARPALPSHWCFSPTVSGRRGRLERGAAQRHARPPRRYQLQLWRGADALRRGVQARGDHRAHGAERLGKVDAAQPRRRLRDARLRPSAHRRRGCDGPAACRPALFR